MTYTVSCNPYIVHCIQYYSTLTHCQSTFVFFLFSVTRQKTFFGGSTSWWEHPQLERPHHFTRDRLDNDQAIMTGLMGSAQ